MIDKIKELRVRIDGLSQLVKELKPILGGIRGVETGKIDSMGFNESVNTPYYINSKEIEETYDSLILAKAWLGKVLGELGSKSPYANDGNRKEIKDIEPTADVNEIFKQTIKDGDSPVAFRYENPNKVIEWNEISHIEKIEYLREAIEDVTTSIVRRYTKTVGFNPHDMAIQHIKEARFWLGFELGRIRDSQP